MKEIEIVSPKYGPKTVFIDDEDYSLFSQHKQKWCVAKRRNDFECRTSYGLCLHRLVLGVENPNIKVFFKDKNKLNCQKSNLEVFDYRNVWNGNELTINSKSYGKHTVIVDSEDVKRLKKHRWYIGKGRSTFYALRDFRKNGKRTNEWIHRVILGVTDPDIEVDHHDHKGLNNVKSNLRKCTSSQNGMNQKKRKGSSRFCGVAFHKAMGKWRASIKINKKLIHLGYYDSEKKAALAYRNASIKYHKEFSPFYSEANYKKAV